MSQKQRKAACECGNDVFYFVKDLNLDKVWKAGNKYTRICTDCGSRYFLSQAMWEASDDTYVILKGDDTPLPLFSCPACEESVTGTPENCPYCDAEFDWSHYTEPGAVETVDPDEDARPEPSSEVEPEDGDGQQRAEPSAEIEVEPADEDDDGDEDDGGKPVPAPLREIEHPDQITEMHYNDMKSLASKSGIKARGKKADLAARIASVRLTGLDEDHTHYEAWVAASDSEDH